MTRTSMVADTWKPLRTTRCVHCKRKFPEGEWRSYWRFCGRCYTKMRPQR